MSYPCIDTYATGKRIESFMKSQELSVSEVQHFLGLSAPQAVYKWLQGKNLPSIDNLLALSKLFATSIDEIIIEKPVEKINNFYPVKFLPRTAERPCVSYSFISLDAA